MSLTTFKNAFIKYISDQNIDFPSELTSVSDANFQIFINKQLKPFKDDVDLAYSNLETLIMCKGYDVPELSDEQKAKIKRFILAFIEVSE